MLVAAVAVMSVIMPYHICSAIFCYVCFILCVSFNIGIGVGKKWSVGYPLAFCEAGLCFALLTMGTGAYWGYHAWGQAWIWEPRLTGMFLTTLFFLSWRLVCAVLGNALVANKKLTSSLIILGLPGIAFTHFAVRLFGGVHPSSVKQMHGVIEEKWAIALVVTGFLMMGAGWVALRVRQVKKGLKKAGRMAQDAP